ncbi:unnamed protein product [Ambrosiozyma monospora]|uniref:Unnamed protein product n=1 Tax=Ambrosiozyma monospora TaxID=43982 RepID=A0A9W6YTC2_AMBMO|nr:unnamed protein product [Ambrosiozyma monospora]
MASSSIHRTDRSPTRNGQSYRERDSGTVTPMTPRTPKTPMTSVPTSEYNAENYWDGVIDIPSTSWIFTMDELKNKTPSRRHRDEQKRLKFADELQKRCKGIFYLFNCCRQLRLSRSVALTAACYFHRFYMRRDMLSFHYFEIAAAALFIACKAEECRRRLGDIVKICSKLAFQGKVTEIIDEDSKIYWKWKDLLTNLEELLLEELCFEVTPDNPYKICSEVLDLQTEPNPEDDKVDEWKLKTRGIFGHCANFLECSARVPLVLLHDVRVLCGLGIIIGAHKEDAILPANLLNGDLQCNTDEVWKCYQELVEMGRMLAPLDPHFHVLTTVPKIARDEFVRVAHAA